LSNCTFCNSRYWGNHWRKERLNRTVEPKPQSHYNRPDVFTFEVR